MNQEVNFSFSLKGSSKDADSSGTGASLLEDKQFAIEIKVNNFGTSEQYIWDTNKFKDRLMVMRDLLQSYEDEGELP